MELPGGDGDRLAPSPSSPGPSVPGRHDEHRVGTFIWPPAGTSTWPPVGTFSWPWTTGKEIQLTPLRGLTSVSGVVARDDDNNRADIFYADSDGEWRRRITITHELAHLFLDHTCAHSDAPDVRDILAMITRVPRAAVIRALENASFEQRPLSERAHGLADSHFDNPDERAAETLGAC